MTSRRHNDKIKIATCLIWLVAFVPVNAEPEVDPSELPRIDPTEPAGALDTFKIVPGHKLELVAEEPLVADPIAMAFDEKGWLFVVEMRGYSERRDEKLGRIRLLIDDDGDGTFDRSIIYARNLAWPTAVIVWDGGIFVAATPDIFYFKDDDGDGVADSKKTVFTGFGAGVERPNVQALVNSFQWGPDGRIHGATAGNGGRVYRVGETKNQITELGGLDFSFDPKTLDFRAENGGGQYGLSFDSAGRKFVCSNSNHIQQIIYSRRYSGSPLPPARVGIAADGPAAEVFRLSPDEPWRIVRTRWRIAGQVNGPVEGGGRVSGYFTAATGICIHRGDAFVCDAGSNLVHRKVFVDSGKVQLVAERPPEEKEVEFLACTDNWFRPVQAISGPNGALYIADMYREVIEHPWSVPGTIKAHLDLNSGNDRGRIYRIVAESQQLPERAQPDPLVQKIVATESLENLSAETRAEFAVLAKHPSPAVRFQLALSLGLRGGDWRIPVLGDVLQSADDRWIRGAALKALGGSAVVAFEKLIATDPLPPDDVLVILAELAAQTTDAKGLEKIRLFADSSTARMQLLSALARSHRAEGWVDTVIGEAEKIAANDSLATGERIAAIHLLSLREEGTRHLVALFGTNPKPEINDAIAEASCRSEGAEWATLLVRHWDSLSATGKTHAINAMLRFESRVPALLVAIKEGMIPAHLIDTSRSGELLRSDQLVISNLAKEIFATNKAPRSKVIDSYIKSLTLPGNSRRGREHYIARCSICHRADDFGSAYGPDVASFRSAGRESVLTNLIDPNREVAPQHAVHEIKLKDGTTTIGRILSQDGGQLQLGLPAGIRQSIDRKQVTLTKQLSQSPMPEGLEAGLSVQEMADLLEFLIAPQTKE
jgi:putative membrane-bound dehydrogenase-like protein